MLKSQLLTTICISYKSTCWVGSLGNCRSYIDLVHMFILLGPRKKEQWFPGESSCHDGGQKCKRPNQNMHLAWIKILCLDVINIMSTHNPLVKESHMTKPNNNGVGSYLLPQCRERSEWIFTLYSYIQINALSSGASQTYLTTQYPWFFFNFVFSKFQATIVI